MIIHIYDKKTLELIAKPVTTSYEDFKENPNLFYPDWNEETMKYSPVLLQNPKFDNGKLREMTKDELYKNGKYQLASNEIVEAGKIKEVELSEFEFIENNEIKYRRDEKIESVKKEHIKKDTHVKQPRAFQSVGPATMNRDPAKMAWTDFSHVADFFPDPPRTGEALNRVLFDIGRLLRIRQEKLMRGIQKAGAGRLLVILDYLLGKGETIRQPEAYFETILRA